MLAQFDQSTRFDPIASSITSPSRPRLMYLTIRKLLFGILFDNFIHVHNSILFRFKIICDIKCYGIHEPRLVLF